MNAKVKDNLSNSEYHSHPAISKSGLDLIARAPIFYYEKHLKEDAEPTKWTDAFTIGAAYHSLVLEPQNFNNDFITLPENLDRRTTEGKETYKAIQEEAKDKILIKSSQKELCEKMASAVLNHAIASRYLDGFGKAELSIFFELDGVECRCRPDYIREDGVIVDLKSAQSADPAIWSKKAFDFRYHVQAAFYSEGYRQAFGELPKGFVFVVGEKDSPFPVSVFRSAQDLLDAGVFDMMRDINTFKQCKLKGHWPSYNDEKELNLNIPYYARNKYLEAINEDNNS